MSTANAVEDHGLTVHFKDELAYSADEQSSRAIGDAIDPARVVPTNTPLTHTLPEATGQSGDTLFPGTAPTNIPLTQKQALPETTGQSVVGTLFPGIALTNTLLAHTESLPNATGQLGDTLFPGAVPTNTILAHTEMFTDATGQSVADTLFSSEADDASYTIYQFINSSIYQQQELNHG